MNSCDELNRSSTMYNVIISTIQTTLGRVIIKILRALKQFYWPSAFIDHQKLYAYFAIIILWTFSQSFCILPLCYNFSVNSILCQYIIFLLSSLRIVSELFMNVWILMRVFLIRWGYVLLLILSFIHWKIDKTCNPLCTELFEDSFFLSLAWFSS